MGLIPVLLQAYQAWNGGKTWTGSIIVLLTYGIQHYLPSLGMDKDAAAIAATTIIQGVGYVILVWGAIHKIIKAAITKKAAGTVAKLLIAGLMIFSFAYPRQAVAVENLKQPFTYFLKSKSIPAGTTSLDTAYWWFKPTVQMPLLILRRSNDGDSKLDVSNLASAGGGITWQRTVLDNGNYYSTISFSILELVSYTVDGRADFSAGLTIGMCNNLFQFGGAYDAGPNGKLGRWILLSGFGINLVR
jgi:hypothetical protein